MAEIEVRNGTNFISPVSLDSVEKLTQKYEQLQRVISKKYIGVVDRLGLEFIPICANNIKFCYEHHVNESTPLSLPDQLQVNIIRSSLEQSRYKVFTDLIWNLCLENKFPGEDVLVSIMKLILTLNPSGSFQSGLEHVVNRLTWLFDIVLREFPPCWKGLHPKYVNFLKSTFKMSEIVSDEACQAKATIFETLLNLLEDIIDDQHQLSRQRPSNSKQLRNAPREGYVPLRQWVQNCKDIDKFSALNKETALDRVMQALHLIAKLLEMDLAMWILRHHNHPNRYVYNEHFQPLIAVVFSLSMYARSTPLAKRTIKLFAACVESKLNIKYLKIMARFISLLAHFHNLSEIETTPEGIAYPFIGPKTMSFTLDFFKIVEDRLKTCIEGYLRLLDVLPCPFVCYEFIDLLLKRIDQDSGSMCPQKIMNIFQKNRWLECLPKAECSAQKITKTANVYREEYLHLLLLALRNYCKLHGTMEYNKVLRSLPKENVSKRKSPSPHTPTASYTELSKMRTGIKKLEEHVNKSTLLCRQQKQELPTVDILVTSELLTRYRTDLKHLVILKNYLMSLQKLFSENFSELQAFLNELDM